VVKGPSGDLEYYQAAMEMFVVVISTYSLTFTS